MRLKNLSNLLDSDYKQTKRKRVEICDFMNYLPFLSKWWPVSLQIFHEISDYGKSKGCWITETSITNKEFTEQFG